MSANDLSPASITDNLGTSFIGQRVLCFPRLASTMDVARQEAQQGAAEGTVIIAGEQTEGRGRVKRPWLSPEGNIALLAVAHTIEAVTGLKPQVKWPNDILVNGKKVCGILTEGKVKGSRVAYSAIGIGINVSLQIADVPEISVTATSLNDELGRNVSRLDVVRHLLVEIERLYLTLPDGESIYEEWRDRLVTLGKRVQVESGGGILEGIAESVDRSGALLIRRSDGASTRIAAGDVTLRDG